jgi:hypothetical protein
MGTILFCNGDVLKVGKVNYGEKKITSSEFTKNMNNSFTMSCTVDTVNSDLKELFEDRGGIDCYIVRGTAERTYPRFPRKLKKALKKLQEGRWVRLTRRMNTVMNLKAKTR